MLSWTPLFNSGSKCWVATNGYYINIFELKNGLYNFVIGWNNNPTLFCDLWDLQSAFDWCEDHNAKQEREK